MGTCCAIHAKPRTALRCGLDAAANALATAAKNACVRVT